MRACMRVLVYEYVCMCVSKISYDVVVKDRKSVVVLWPPHLTYHLGPVQKKVT